MAREYQKARELIDQNRSTYPADVLGLLEQFVNLEEQYWMTSGTQERLKIENQQKDIESQLHDVMFDIDGFGDFYITVRVLATSVY